MKILVLNPFNSGSHHQWAKGLAKHSCFDVEIWNLKGKYWKWRMHGAAISFAERFSTENPSVDLIIGTDMMDFASFLALCKKDLSKIKTAVYFHENQLTYPWQIQSEDLKKKRDMHYAFLNYTSALACDLVLFNSNFHKDAFTRELLPFLKAFPDERNLHTVDLIKKKSQVLHLGVDLTFFDQYQVEKNKKPTLLWNHRHEHDKNPDLFFNTLMDLSSEGYQFDLVVLGESYEKAPPIFSKAKEKLKNHLIHWGYASSRQEYAKLLWQSTHIPITSNHDFFGQSLIEAVYCGAVPILPNRLVYPEHFGEYKELFFDQDSDFKSCLINSMELRKQPKNIAALTKKYNWPKLIDKYDQVFQNIT